jgi:hypothetical protein
MNIFFLEYAVLGIFLLISGFHYLRTISVWKQESYAAGTKTVGKLHHVRNTNGSHDSPFTR